MSEPSGLYTLILPASQIPDGAIVTKRTGEKPYRLTRKVKVYVNNIQGNGADMQELVPAPGSVYLLPEERGLSINQYPEDIPLAVHFSELEDLQDFLDEVQRGEP